MAFTYDHKDKSAGQPDAPVFFHRMTYDVDGDDYTTNGLELDWADAGLDDEFVGKTIIAVIGVASAGYQVEYDYTAGKLKVFYCDNDAVADGPYIEYPNATGLTATFTLLVIAV